MESLQTTAERVNQQAISLGAEEVTVSISTSVSTEMSQRAGIVEKSQQSHSVSIGVSLLVNGRYSVHSASDPRPEAMRVFLERAIAATRYLEPDEHRGLPSLASMGVSDAEKLDVYDENWSHCTPTTRRAELSHLEAAAQQASSEDPVRSISVWLWDAQTNSCMLCSNGYYAQWRRTQFGHGGEITLEQGERLPEAYDFYSARHKKDLPPADFVARSLINRGRRRLGSKAIKSVKLPMLLENRAVGRILNVLLGPMNGSALYEKRSCLLEKQGERIANENFSIYSDPSIPRGLGSFPYDGDGLAGRKLALVEDGVLQNYFIGIYNGRRLQTAPTSSSMANITMPHGQRTPQEILQSLPRAIRVEGFLGGNTNAITGDYSFGITGTLFENGNPVQGVSEMNISGNVFTLLQQWQKAGSDVWTFGSYRVPSLLFDGIQFSGL